MKPFSTRALTPRWQATILPVNSAGRGRRVAQRVASTALPTDRTTGSGAVTPAVIDAPTNVAVAPPDPVTVSVDWNSRVCVDAATVVVHGDRWLAVPAPGPSLPADAATNTPAA